MKTRILTGLLSLVFAAVRQAQAPPDLTSSFDASIEDWRARTNTAALAWQANLEYLL